MADNTGIEWADAMWNAIAENHILDPLRWKRPRRISVCDLFHPGVTDEMLDRIFAVMALCPQHTFQVLTKRPERMLAYLQAPVMRIHDAIQVVTGASKSQFRWPLPNVWLGVSVENRAAKHRIDTLRETPAAIRFLSLEPLLEDLGELNLEGIDWVIVGGESGTGPGIRPMHPAWVRMVRDQCVAAGVPFFFKQWGEFAEITEPTEARNRKTGNFETVPAGGGMMRVGKKAAGRMLDGREWDEMPGGSGPAEAGHRRNTVGVEGDGTAEAVPFHRGVAR